MEALGVASAAAGLLSLTLTVYRQVSLFILSTKQAENRDSYETELQNELQSISLLLVQLQYNILRPELASSVLGLDSRIHDGIRLLENLKQTYSYRPPTIFLRKLHTKTKVPFRKTKVHSRRRQDRDLNDLKECRGFLEDGAKYVIHIHSSNLQIEPSQRRLEILQWLSPLDHRERFHELRRKRVLLKDSKRAEYAVNEFNIIAGVYSREIQNFGLWRHREVPQSEKPNTLWCHGLAGSGKSMLTSLLIDRLSEDVAENSHAVAYYFVDYKFKKVLSEIIAILLKQLCLLTPEIPGVVVKLFTQATEDEQRPSLEALLKTINSVCCEFSSTSIVIDAVDEHGSRHEMVQLLHVLRTLKCDLLLTSRCGVSAVPEAFPPSLLELEVEPDAQAISCFIEKRVEESEDLQFVDSAAKEKIVQELLREGGNNQAVNCQNKDTNRPNFLLASLQVDRLLEQFSNMQNKKTSKHTSLDLKQMLNDAWRRIEELPSGNGSIAKNALMWILYAKRPLSMSELCTALSIRDTTLPFDHHAIPTPKLVLQSCAGLIAVDGSGSTVSLVHYQVHEYFQEIGEKLFPQGREYLALTCVLYLTSVLKYYPHDLDSEEYWVDAVSLNPFLDYAAYNWISHCQDRPRVENDTAQTLRATITSAILELLGLAKTATLPCNVLIPVSRRVLSGTFSLRPLWEYQLHLAARFGLLDEVKYLIEHHPIIEPAPCISALHWSAAEGTVEIARLLIASGGDRARRDEEDSIPLHYAAFHGCLEMVKYLDSRFSRKLQDIEKPPLDLGDKSEDYLLNSQDRRKRTPLHVAAANGHTAIVQRLCSRKANLSLADNLGCSAIHLAVMNGHGPTVAVLISKGASVDVRDDQGLTPLHHAASRGSEPILNRLLMSGADLSATDKQKRTPLHLAAVNKQSAIINTLLSSGASINDQDLRGETALVKAIKRKDIGIVKTFLEYGASFEKRMDDGATALHQAAQEGDEGMVRLLLRYGSNPNLKDREELSACDYAKASGHRAIADLLIMAAGKTNRRVPTELRIAA